MTLINIASDSGFGYGMSKSPIREVKIGNFIKEIPSYEVDEIVKNVNELNDRNILLKYNNTYYAVGQLAKKIDPKIERPLSSSRIGDDDHLVELLALIGRSCDNTSYDVNLMVALPEVIIDKAEEFEKWMTRKFEFSFITKDNECKKSIRIVKTYCTSQGLAPIFNLTSSEKENSILSIDHGHNTFNVRYWNHGQTPRNYSLYGDGTKTVYEELEKRLIERFKDEYNLRKVRETDLELAIETGVFKISGKRKDITDLLDIAFESKSKDLFKKIDKKYSDILPSVDLILANGGIMENENFLKRLSDKFKGYNLMFATMDESQWAVTRGMYKYLCEIEEDDFTNASLAEVACDEQ